MDRNRNLTPADVEAIAEKLEEAMVRRLKLNVGAGVLALAWKWVLMAIIAIAGYGAAGGFKKWGGVMRAANLLRGARRRRSVRAHLAGFAVAFAGGVWSALPNAWIDTMPRWLVFVVPCALSLYGVIAASREE